MILCISMVFILKMTPRLEKSSQAILKCHIATDAGVFSFARGFLQIAHKRGHIKYGIKFRGVGNASATFEFSPNFSQVYIKFANPSFQDLNGSHIMFWNMIILNLSRIKVEPHSKYWNFCIKCRDLLSLRFSENAVLFHIERLCRKTAGNGHHIVTPGWLTEHVLHRLIKF